MVFNQQKPEQMSRLMIDCNLVGFIQFHEFQQVDMFQVIKTPASIYDFLLSDTGIGQMKSSLVFDFF